MDIQDKTKEELINELQELQQAYNALKVSAEADVIAHKQAEKDLLKSRELLKSMEKAAKIGGWEFDVETMVQTWTEETFHILEIDTTHGTHDVPEGIGFIAPEYQPIALLGIQRAIEFGEPYNQEWEVITAKGNKRWVNAIATPYQENGKTKSVSGSFQDITKRRQAEAALKESEENLYTTLQSIGDAVISTDNNGLVVSMNPVAETLCGWQLAEALGKPLSEIFTIINAETRHTVADPVNKVFEKGEIVGLANHTILVSRDGTESQIADSAAPIKNKEGAITGVVLVFSDITGSYIAQKQIKESEERYRLLFQNHTAGFALHEIILNAKGKPCDYRFLDVNPAFETLTGLKAIEIIGKSVMEVMPNIEPAWIETYGDVALKGKIINFENYSNDLNKHYQVSAYSPEPGKFATVFLDITERKQSESDLHTSNEFNQTLLNTIPFGMGIVDESGNILYLSEGLKQHFGEGALSKKCWELYRDDKIHCVDCPLQAGIKTGLTQTHEIHGVLGGKIFEVSHTGMIFKGQKAMLKIFIDITERKQAEFKLIEKDVQFRNLANSGPALIWTSGTDKLCNYFNESWMAFTGRTLEQELGNGWAEGVHPDDFDQCLATYVAAFDRHEPFEMEYRLRHASGEYRWILDLGTPNFKSTGEFIGYIGNCFDITERKLIEKELFKAKERAEESDRLKSAFLANMSHEIRTPMNGILGFAELLKEPGLTGEKQQEYIRIIEKSGARMLNIINDIVDISKIESGLIEVNPRESNIIEQMEYVYTFFKPEIENKRLQFVLKRTMSAKEAIITTDSEKVYAIMTNLVKNAIKYTNEGSIVFGCDVVETRHALSLLQFYVKDTGIGIPKDRQSAIFERFIQADISDKMARQGAGLGLSISKAYIEMLGGKIWVESEEGIGSTFYFTLPYNAAPEEKSVNSVADDATKNDNKNLKILIAEDDEISEMLITIGVEKFGKEIIKARTGLEAVEVCRNNSDTDLILMDIQMPVMNGHEATRQIRQFNKDVVIIAQTAFGLSGDREKAIAAGCNDYITKPIKRDKLVELIQKYFKQ